MDKLTKPLYFLATILVIIVVGSISHAAFDELKGDSYEVIKAEEIIDDTLIIQQDDQGRIYIKQNDQVLAKVIPEKNILEKNDRSYYLSEGTLWQEDQMQLTAAQEMMVMYELATPQVLEIFWGTAIDRVHYRQQIPIYADRQLTKELTRVTVDQSIAVLETLFDGVYKVLLEDSSIGYADTRFIRITQSDIPPIYEELPENLDLSRVFVVSQNDQRLYVYEKIGAGYQLANEIVVSTGTEAEHTPNGYYSIKSRRGPWFYNPKYQAGGKYFIEFKGSYLLHSVACDKDGNPLPERIAKLGQKATSGCVGMPMEDAKHIYQIAKPNMLLIIDNKRPNLEQVFKLNSM